MEPTSNAPGGGRITVTSYNVRRCVGLDRVRDPSRIRRVLSHIGADVIGLQEVDSEAQARLAEDESTLESLASALDMTALAGPAMRREDAGYGNGLLTRLEVEDVLRHDLSMRGREPRGALEVVLRSRGHEFTVVNTHLGLRPRERARQIEILLGRISRIRTSLLIVLGDFNEWTRFGRFRRALGKLGGAPRGPRTFPAHRPVLALDQIWARPAGHLGRVRALETELTRIASDHLPIFASVGLGGPPWVSENVGGHGERPGADPGTERESGERDARA